MSLLGPRIRIRPVQHEDLPFLQAMWNDGAVMRFQGYPDGMHATEAEMERWWQGITPGAHALASLPSPHAVVELQNGTPVGELSYSLDAKRRARLDLKLAGACRGEGWATEALQVMLRELFATGAAEKVIVEPTADNAPAHALLGRVGFHPAPTENHPDRWECTRESFAEVAPTEW